MNVWIRKVSPNATRMRIGSSTQNGRFGLARLADRSRQAATLAAWSPSDAGPSDAGPSDAGPSDAGPSDMVGTVTDSAGWFRSGVRSAAKTAGTGWSAAGSAPGEAVSGPSAAARPGVVLGHRPSGYGVRPCSRANPARPEWRTRRRHMYAAVPNRHPDAPLC